VDSKLVTPIERALLDLLNEVCSNAAFVSKYGGVVVESIPGNTESQFMGYFIYEKHTSIEFSYGADLSDPYKVLEGTGKKRRHIKLVDVQDIQTKHVREMIAKAYELVMLRQR
jgi:hypothetical protein